MVLSALAAILVFLSHNLSTQAPQPVSSQAKPLVVVVATLNKALSAKKLKVGDKITAQVVQDVIMGGKILIPRESKLVGHITIVEALTKTDPESRLALLFDQGQLKSGGALKFHGMIQALGPPLPDSFPDFAPSAPSPLGSRSNAGPVNGGGGQSNAPIQTPSGRPRDPGVRALEDREKALDDAHNPEGARPGRAGALGSARHGVFGLPGVFLSNNGPVSTLISVGKNVELKSGSQIVLALDSLSTSTNK